MLMKIYKNATHTCITTVPTEPDRLESKLHIPTLALSVPPSQAVSYRVLLFLPSPQHDSLLPALLWLAHK